MSAAYKELTHVFTRLSRLEHVAAIMGWDSSVNLSKKGVDSRGAAMGEVRVIVHGLITDPKLVSLFEEAHKAESDLSIAERANLREMEREYAKENLLPASHVERKAIATTKAEDAWRSLRAANDWEGFRPILKELVELFREEAKMLASMSKNPGGSIYDALLDLYEPGSTVEMIDRVFCDLKRWLPDLLRDVVKKRAGEQILTPQGPFPIEKQKALGEECMRLLQFDFDAGRLDISAHPFCGGVPDDVRLTTRYSTENFDEGVMGIIHETGHSKYEQNRPAEWLAQPAGQPRSMGVHESQSLFAEMQIGRSSLFLQALRPLLVKHFGDQAAFEHGNLCRHCRRVAPGLIRVDADEVSYPLHVILRYEIERALIEGTMEVEQIPEVWDSKMKEYLGMDTKGNFKDGCMQDIHWACGLFGYFPSYTLGAMYAAQMMAAVRRDLGEEVVDQAIRTAELGPILAWQKDKVWSKGSLLTTDELIVKATGEPLNPQFFKKHLEERYLNGLF